MLDSGALNKIEAFLINTRLISKMSPPYEMTSVALIDLMKEKIPRAFSLLASAFRAIKSTSDIWVPHLDHLAASLITFHATILKIKSQKPLWVKSCLSMDDYIIQEAELPFLRQSSVKFLIEQPVTKKRNRWSSSHLIIYDYDPHVNEELPCPIHHLPNIPTQEDWTLLMDRITHLNSATSTTNYTGYFNHLIFIYKKYPLNYFKSQNNSMGIFLAYMIRSYMCLSVDNV